MSNNYKWIESARLMRMKTQKQVAEAIEISQGKLSKVEQGLQRISNEILNKLADYYELPADYFRQEWDPTPVQVFFRRKLSVSPKLIDSIQEEIRIKRCAIDTLMEAINDIDYDLEFSSALDGKIDIPSIAAAVRYKFKCINGPISNLASKVESHGIIILPFEFQTDKIDGLSTISSRNRKLIFLNTLLPGDRMRFSLAHELGHLIMHADKIPEDARTFEQEANEFASELLMPEAEIRSQLRGLNFKTLLSLKRRWGVSMHALVRRALDLHEIDYQTYRNFQISFSKYGYTKNEPQTVLREKASVFDEVINLYKKNLGYSDAELMRLMRIGKRDYWNWTRIQGTANIIPFENGVQIQKYF